MHKLEHWSEAERLFELHRAACQDRAPIYLWDMRKTGAEAAVACGAAFAYLVSCGNEYPAEWATEAKNVLKQCAPSARISTPVLTTARAHVGATLEERWEAVKRKRPAVERVA